MNRINGHGPHNSAHVLKFIPRNTLATMFDEAFEAYQQNQEKEQFGTFTQGFFGVKDGNNCDIIPFAFHNEKQKEKVRDTFKNIRCTQVGISFSTGYCHYGN